MIDIDSHINDVFHTSYTLIKEVKGSCDSLNSYGYSRRHVWLLQYKLSYNAILYVGAHYLLY